MRWLAELSLILEQVHNLDFFHRDIKPSNIMLQANGCLVLIDFGTVRQLSNSYIQKFSAGQITGVISSGYTPIEQMRGKAVKQSDLYALGGTIIYLLTALNPLTFYNPHRDKIEWSKAVENVPPELINLVDSMISSFPANRPTSARAIFQEIVKIDSSLQSVENYWLKASDITSFQSVQARSQTAFSNNNSTQPIESHRQVSSQFIDLCSHNLAEFIGPIATIICTQTLAANPHLSTEDFVQSLAKKIPNAQDAKQFRQRLL